MRAVRLAAELGLSIEEATQAGITANAKLLTNISMERIRDELLRILAARYSADGILVLKTTGLLSLIVPEFDAAFDTPQKKSETPPYLRCGHPLGDGAQILSLR